MILAWLLGCASPPSPVGDPVVEVELPPGDRVRFVLDGAESAPRLRLDGGWWGVHLTLDGAALPAVYPGYAPLDVPLPDLAAGPHELAVSMSLPSTEPWVLALPNKNRWPQRPTLTLVLGDGPHVGSLAVPLVKGELQPVVTVEGAPAGATVELVVQHDGEVVHRWEPVPVGAPFPPMKLRGRRWEVSNPELYVATAILRDGEKVLDQRSLRTGFREVELVDGSLRLGGEPFAVMALHGGREDELPTLLTTLQAGGGNAVEIHGTVTPARFFAVADELGLPLVYVPRCDGRLWSHGDDPRTTWKRLHAELREQEERLLSASAARPSLLVWVCEGTEDVRSDACGGLHTDPLHRPVLGLDVPAAGISGRERQASRPKSWNVEIGLQPGPGPSPAQVAQAFLVMTGTGGPGGVFLSPRPGDQGWAAAWQGAAKQLGITAWRPSSARATSTLVVKGVEPGRFVTVQAPWAGRIGAVANAAGEATIPVWHVGEVVVDVGGVSRTVELREQRWTVGEARLDSGEPTVVAVGG